MWKALKIFGDPCEFEITCFDFNGTGYVKTATDVSFDNSALMQCIRQHEHVLEKAVVGICLAAIATLRSLGAAPPDERNTRVSSVDLIITGATNGRQQNMAKAAAGPKLPVEHRAKWYGDGDTPLQIADTSGGLDAKARIITRLGNVRRGLSPRGS